MKEDKERIKQLEETVKHLILAKKETERLADPTGEDKTTLEDYYKKDQEHNTIFKKFLQSISK